MKIGGIHSTMPVTGGVGNGEASVERKIQALQRDLNQLEQKQELTEEEEKEKQKLEERIAGLKQQLQEIRSEENKGQEEKKSLKEPLKEEGKRAEGG